MLRSGTPIAGDGIVLVDGPEVIVPGVTVGEPAGKPCRVLVTLRGVFYGGSNVGSRWRYAVSTSGGAWVSAIHRARWLHFDPVGQQVSDQVYKGGCERDILVTIGVEAREYDGYLFDDIGHAVTASLIHCTRERTGQQVILPVPVPEYPYWPWLLLFRRKRPVAMMYFIFDVTAECVDRG